MFSAVSLCIKNGNFCYFWNKAMRSWSLVTWAHQKIKALFWWCFKIYFNIYLVIVIYFMNFMNFDFIFEFFLLHQKKLYTLKLIVTLTRSLNFSPLRHDICLKFFSSIQRMSCTADTIRWKMVFFNHCLRQTKCSVYLTNLFCLLTISSHQNVFNKIVI